MSATSSNSAASRVANGAAKSTDEEKAILADIDTDASGTISAKELTKYMSEDDAKAFLAYVDTDALSGGQLSVHLLGEPVLAAARFLLALGSHTRRLGELLHCHLQLVAPRLVDDVVLLVSALL